MSKLIPVAVAAASLFTLPLRAEQKSSPPSRTEFVDLDAVVVDADGQPVSGLRHEDFRVKEDGRTVAVTSFTEVSAIGAAGQGDARVVALLLEDYTAYSARLVPVIQGVARMFVDRMRPADSLSVVHWTQRDEEVAGDRAEALQRISEFRGWAPVWHGRLSIEESLKSLSRLARGFDPIDHRRKVVVCVGAPRLCDLYLPPPEDGSLLWPAWRDALGAMARANVSVYMIDPFGLMGAFDLGGGLVEKTGGRVFVRSNNFERAVDLIWREAGHYYRLGYAPSASPRELHSIDVTVARPGLRVHARQSRGD